MQRFFVRTVALGLMGMMCLGGVAQTKRKGAAPVTAKAARVETSSDLAGTIEGLLAGPEVVRAHWGLW